MCNKSQKLNREKGPLTVTEIAELTETNWVLVNLILLRMCLYRLAVCSDGRWLVVGGGEQ